MLLCFVNPYPSFKQGVTMGLICVPMECQCVDLLNYQGRITKLLTSFIKYGIQHHKEAPPASPLCFLKGSDKCRGGFKLYENDTIEDYASIITIARGYIDGDDVLQLINKMCAQKELASWMVEVLFSALWG
jgi:hypothetical protein